MPLLHAEVARQPAAAGRPGHLRAGTASSRRSSASQPRIEAWWQCGWATTWTPVRSGSGDVEPVDQLGQGQHAAGDLGGPRVVGELDGVTAQRRQAGRLETEDRHAALDVRRQRGDRALDDRSRAGPADRW